MQGVVKCWKKNSAWHMIMMRVDISMNKWYECPAYIVSQWNVLDL